MKIHPTLEDGLEVEVNWIKANLFHNKKKIK